MRTDPVSGHASGHAPGPAHGPASGPASGPVPRYFAYGSNLDPDQMVRRGVPFLSVVGAVLRDHRLAFDYPAPRRWLGFAADVVPEPGSLVEGALYELVSEGLLDVMDAWEGVPERAYERRLVGVEPIDGGPPVTAWTYTVVEPAHEDLPSPGYAGIMYTSARRLGLSPSYVAGLAIVLERSRDERGAQLAVLEALALSSGTATMAEVASLAGVEAEQAEALLEDLCGWGWAVRAGGGFALVDARRGDVRRVTGGPDPP
jgi:hypothetical protein